MTTPILYSFRRCPYAIRARMALHYSEIRCELREVVLKDKPQAMLNVSAKGTVPVLQLQDRVIDESIEVMRWALQQGKRDDWHVADLDHDLLIDNDGTFKHYLDRYKYFDRYPEHPQSFYFAHANQFITELEEAMTGDGSGEYFLLRPVLSAIDVAIFPFVRQFAFVDKPAFDALNLPKVQQWLAMMLDQQLFKSVMGKNNPWSAQASSPIFL